MYDTLTLRFLSFTPIKKPLLKNINNGLIKIKLSLFELQQDC